MKPSSHPLGRSTRRAKSKAFERAAADGKHVAAKNHVPPSLSFEPDSPVPERIMWPEFTGSPECGCNQVVLRVWSLEERHLLLIDRETPAILPRVCSLLRRVRPQSRSLDEEDPAVSAHSVRPVVGQGVPSERCRHDRSHFSPSTLPLRTLFQGAPDNTRRQGAGGLKGKNTELEPSRVPDSQCSLSSKKERLDGSCMY